MFRQCGLSKTRHVGLVFEKVESADTWRNHNTHQFSGAGSSAVLPSKEKRRALVSQTVLTHLPGIAVDLLPAPPYRIDAREVVPGTGRFEVAVGVNALTSEVRSQDGHEEVGALGEDHRLGGRKWVFFSSGVDRLSASLFCLVLCNVRLAFRGGC